ncbi:Protein glass, partial [Fragariocoptes setiger]
MNHKQRQLRQVYATPSFQQAHKTYKDLTSAYIDDYQSDYHQLTSKHHDHVSRSPSSVISISSHIYANASRVGIYYHTQQHQQQQQQQEPQSHQRMHEHQPQSSSNFNPNSSLNMSFNLNMPTRQVSLMAQHQDNHISSSLHQNVATYSALVQASNDAHQIQDQAPSLFKHESDDQATPFWHHLNASNNYVEQAHSWPSGTNHQYNYHQNYNTNTDDSHLNNVNNQHQSNSDAVTDYNAGSLMTATLVQSNTNNASVTASHDYAHNQTIHVSNHGYQEEQREQQQTQQQSLWNSVSYRNDSISMTPSYANTTAAVSFNNYVPTNFSSYHHNSTHKMSTNGKENGAWSDHHHYHNHQASTSADTSLLLARVGSQASPSIDSYQDQAPSLYKTSFIRMNTGNNVNTIDQQHAHQSDDHHRYTTPSWVQLSSSSSSSSSAVSTSVPATTTATNYCNLYTTNYHHYPNQISSQALNCEPPHINDSNQRCQLSTHHQMTNGNDNVGNNNCIKESLLLSMSNSEIKTRTPSTTLLLDTVVVHHNRNKQPLSLFRRKRISRIRLSANSHTPTKQAKSNKNNSNCDVEKLSLESSGSMNVCNICGRDYARPSTLKTHMRTHTNERPYR